MGLGIRLDLAKINHMIILKTFHHHRLCFPCFSEVNQLSNTVPIFPVREQIAATASKIYFRSSFNRKFSQTHKPFVAMPSFLTDDPYRGPHLINI